MRLSAAKRVRISLAFAVLAAGVLIPRPSAAQREIFNRERVSLKDVEGLVWHSGDSTLTFEKIAALCAPRLWFSPDEPLLHEVTGEAIRIPAAFPFEDQPERPVVYYRIRRLLVRGDAVWNGVSVDRGDPGKTAVDMSALIGIDIDYFFYYPTEEGFGGHEHDVESVEMKALVGQRRHVSEGVFHMAVWKVVAKAHGILWYDNTLEVDEYTSFPITILVEEGKHASCTDKNADGYYTPGYDVNRRINDAWGVRDIIRSGGLSTGGFESWMAKVRDERSLIMPPVPEESPYRERFVVDGVFAPGSAVYELRPFPGSERAEESLKPFIDDKGYRDWPETEIFGDLKTVSRWFVDESFMKSFSIAYRYDGDNGIVFNLPFFIVKNFEEKMSGGWIVHRIYLKDEKLKDFGYNLLYTTSASRWVDGYFALGFEIDAWDTPEGRQRKTYFVTEPGIKFRANLKHSPLKFMTRLGTDFWGLRIGVKYTGAWSFTDMGYVVEIGAGVW